MFNRATGHKQFFNLSFSYEFFNSSLKKGKYFLKIFQSTPKIGYRSSAECYEYSNFATNIHLVLKIDIKRRKLNPNFEEQNNSQ
jgi:hypothetical protein